MSESVFKRNVVSLHRVQKDVGAHNITSFSYTHTHILDATGIAPKQQSEISLQYQSSL